MWGIWHGGKIPSKPICIIWPFVQGICPGSSQVLDPLCYISDLTYIHMRTNQHQWMLQCHWHRSVCSLKSVINLLKRWQSHFQNESFYFQFADRWYSKWRWYILNKFCCYVHHMNFCENFLRNDQEKFWTCCLHDDYTLCFMQDIKQQG